MKIILNTDGASRGNPGPASYGFVLSNDKGEVLYREGKVLGITTNNVAEYTAVLQGLSYIFDNYPDSEITVISDSQLIIQQLKGVYKIKSEHLKKIYLRIKDIEENLNLMEYKSVPRAENKLADAMANLALDKNLQ